MNKKALGMEMFNVLIAAAVIATAFFIFYSWYGSAQAPAIDRIDVKSADLEQGSVLLNLLNHPVENGWTVADFVVSNNPQTARLVDDFMKKSYGSVIAYKLLYDGTVIADTIEQPLFSFEQSALIPVPGSNPKNIILRFGV